MPKLCGTQLILVLIPSLLPGSEEEEWIEEDDGSYCTFHYFLSLLLGKVMGQCVLPLPGWGMVFFHSSTSLFLHSTHALPCCVSILCLCFVFYICQPWFAVFAVLAIFSFFPSLRLWHHECPQGLRAQHHSGSSGGILWGRCSLQWKKAPAVPQMRLGRCQRHVLSRSWSSLLERLEFTPSFLPGV